MSERNPDATDPNRPGGEPTQGAPGAQGTSGSAGTSDATGSFSPSTAQSRTHETQVVEPPARQGLGDTQVLPPVTPQNGISSPPAWQPPSEFAPNDRFSPQEWNNERPSRRGLLGWALVGAGAVVVLSIGAGASVLMNNKQVSKITAPPTTTIAQAPSTSSPATQGSVVVDPVLLARGSVIAAQGVDFVIRQRGAQDVTVSTTADTQIDGQVGVDPSLLIDPRLQFEVYGYQASDGTLIATEIFSVQRRGDDGEGGDDN